MKQAKNSCFFILFVFMVNLNAIAQPFTITGKVIDAGNSEPLVGASVSIGGTTKGTVTNFNGEFSLDIKKGNATLKVSFIGYLSKEIPLILPVDKSKGLTIYLEENTTDLGEVKVSGRFEGQMKAMFDQKEADNIKNLVNAEQISQFPDMNAAEAMQRISGITLQRDKGEGRFVQLRGTPPELTNFNINGEQIPSPEGNVRYVGLDVISADQIENIEITKALTPDMDGDGIGGTVNIVTKTAHGNKPKMDIMITGGYNNISGKDNYQVQLSFGQRFKKVGFQISGSYSENKSAAHNMEFKFGKSPIVGDDSDSLYIAYRDVQLRHYDINRTRIGLSSTLDYEFNKKSKIYLRGMYNSYSDAETRRRIRYKMSSGDMSTVTSYREADIVRDMKDREKIQKIASLNFGGEHDFGFMKWDYEAAYSIATESKPDQIEVSFDNTEISMRLNLDDPNWPIVYFPSEKDSTKAYDYTQYEFDEYMPLTSYTYDKNLTFKTNFTFPYEFSNSNKGLIKFGFKMRSKEKARDIVATVYNKYYETFLPGTRQIYTQIGTELNVTTVSDGFQENNLLNRGYSIDAIAGPDEFRNFFEYYQQNFKIQESDTKMKTYGEDYFATENISAGYLMVKHNFNKFMFLGGIRYERTDVAYQGNSINTEKGNFRSLDTLTDNRTHVFWLPQFHFKYSIDKNTNIRAAVTYSYSRPNFEDILPYRQQDLDEISYGNPDLNFPLSLNVDILAEKYFQKGSVISGSLFYKEIDDFVFYYKRWAHEDSLFSSSGLHEITMAVNGLEAFVAGAELTSNFKFNFLPGIFKNFGLYMNYTFTYSEAYIKQRIAVDDFTAVFEFGDDGSVFFTDNDDIETIPLPGQSMHTANVALFYDTKRFYAKLSANYQDAFLDELGPDKDLDVYYDKSFHLDFSADYMLNETVNIFANATNLTNNPLKYYMGSSDRIKQQEFYSWTARIGIKVKL